MPKKNNKNEMEYQKLGLTDLKISRIGFGCAAIGGYDYGKVDDRDSIFAIHKALDLGINFFDTADVYGFGHSEEILSKALGKYRKKVIIATKFGVKWNKNSKTSHDISPKRVIEALDGSLRRLRIDCIPLYQIHWPDFKTPISETIEVLKKCQKAGKIKHIGCSNFSSDLIRDAQKAGRLESLQVPYNIVNRDIEKTLLPSCKKWKMSVIAYSPLCQGLFSGKFDQGIKFGEDDRRSRDKDFQKERLYANLIVVDKLKEMAIQYGKSCIQVAIRWILDNPFITSAIVGVKTSKQIEENIGALGWTFLRKDKELLTKTAINAYKKYNLEE